MESNNPVANRIRLAIETGLKPSHLEIIDESYKHAKHTHMMVRGGTAVGTQYTHFKIRVVADGFKGKTRLERHRAINSLVADEMGPGKVHAIAIEARAPDE